MLELPDLEQGPIQKGARLVCASRWPRRDERGEPAKRSGEP
jgi:hypothetical protein